MRRGILESVGRLLVAVALLAVAVCAPAAAKTPLRHVVIVVAGDLSIRDLAGTPHPRISRLIRNDCAGLMTIRTGRPTRDIEPTDEPGMEPQCVSLGAGAMAVGGAEARRAISGDDGGAPARSVYAARIGDPGSAEVLHLEAAWLRRANEAASYHARPGALGSAVRAAGLRTAVIGNSDIPGEKHREAVCIAADELGRVDFGDVSSPALHVPDGSAPYGFRTDSDALLKEVDRVLSLASLVVVDFGDTFRAGRYARFCTPERADTLRYLAVAHLDAFLNSLTARLDSGRDLLVVLSPSPRPFSDLDGERLAPIIVRGPGFRGGMLTSPSTRTAGVVTIADVAPAVLEFLGVGIPHGMQGRGIESTFRDDTEQTLLQLNLGASRQAQRQPIMRGASVAQSVAVVAVTLIALLSTAGPWRELARWLVLIPAALPLAMLYMPLVYRGGLVGAIAVLSVLTLVVVALCRWLLRSPALSLAVLCLLMITGLAVDILLGAPLISRSVAGYSLVEGARFYGIGNELMGTLLGAALAGLGLTLGGSRIGDRTRSILALVASVAVVLLIGHPGLGANAGGAVAAVAAVLVWLLVRCGFRLSWRTAALVAGGTLVLAALLLAVDALRGSDAQSHFGRAAGMAADGGVRVLLLTAQRKIALNLMLVSTSMWSRLLLVSLVGAAALWSFGRSRFGTGFLDREESAAATAATVGAVCAFAFNDSGVVAAATCAVLLWSLLAVRCLEMAPGTAKTGERTPSGAQVDPACKPTGS